MILNTESLQFIQTAVNVAKLVGIDSIIIEPGRVRGISSNKAVSIFQENAPEFEFGSIGLTRIVTFQSRLDIIRSQKDYVIEAIIDEESPFVRSLVMRSNNMNIDYRCANPTAIQAPTVINDKMKYKIPLQADAVDLLQRGITAMQTDEVFIISNNKGVSFQLRDVNNDIFNHQFATPLQVETDMPEDSKEFNARYSAKILLAIFKEEPEEETFFVGQKGVLRFPVHNINIFVLPKV